MGLLSDLLLAKALFFGGCFSPIKHLCILSGLEGLRHHHRVAKGRHIRVEGRFALLDWQNV